MVFAELRFAMHEQGDIEGLSECIAQAVQEHLTKSNINFTWPQIDGLIHPILRIEAFLEEADANNTADESRSGRVASVCQHMLLVDLSPHSSSALVLLPDAEKEM